MHANIVRSLMARSLKAAIERGCDPYNTVDAAARHYDRKARDYVRRRDLKSEHGASIALSAGRFAMGMR